MEITQGMIDLYKIREAFVMGSRDPRDTAEVYVVLQTPEKKLPTIYGTVVIEKEFGEGSFKSVSISNVASPHSLSNLARKEVRKHYNQIAVRLFRIWKDRIRRL